MKKVKLYGLLLCMSLLILMTLPCTASAKQVLLSPTHGEIEEGTYVELDFYVPVESNVTISFIGHDSSFTNCTYGEYFAWLKDTAGDIFWNDYDSNSFDDRDFDVKLAAGNYKLGMRCEDWKFEYYVTVTANPTASVPVQSLKLNVSKAKMAVGKTKQLTANFQPYYTTENLTWSSSNKKVAAVSSSGIVTAQSLGTATITAQMGNKTAKCTITVNSAELNLARTFSKDLKSLTKNISGLKKSTYKSNKTAIAAVNKSGKVTAKKKGTAKITVSDKKKNKYTITVKVKEPLTATISYIDDTSIYNELGVRFENNTSKKITYIKLNILQYDNRGHKLKSPYSYFYFNNTLLANDSILWEYWVNDDTKKAKISITKVWFSDGSTWKP